MTIRWFEGDHKMIVKWGQNDNHKIIVNCLQVNFETSILLSKKWSYVDGKIIIRMIVK
jgi:hypothetical protein